MRGLYWSCDCSVDQHSMCSSELLHNLYIRVTVHSCAILKIHIGKDSPISASLAGLKCSIVGGSINLSTVVNAVGFSSIDVKLKLVIIRITIPSISRVANAYNRLLIGIVQLQCHFCFRIYHDGVWVNKLAARRICRYSGCRMTAYHQIRADTTNDNHNQCGHDPVSEALNIEFFHVCFAFYFYDNAYAGILRSSQGVVNSA
jgi:hypothetical protein